ncbi:hypothetical protein Poly24_09060 [Rosistilla carotiformis]|uniref:Uncharacterized protein n=1 Tax=Rosistilla carotiformis TaxID=2528017 RepID=A0A518JNU7_9BACT|nr:hypothetical protein [Rosistilla carotiformis]QDV67213.1 hypothetical protein Poly24_09060 [Rosistilla carotiformis]
MKNGTIGRESPHPQIVANHCIGDIPSIWNATLSGMRGRSNPNLLSRVDAATTGITRIATKTQIAMNLRPAA